MLCRALLLYAVSLSTAFPSNSGLSVQHNQELITNVTVFDPPADYTVPRTLYARTLLLSDSDARGQARGSTCNVLLATWENYLPNNDTSPYFPIYQSTDLGKTWTERTKVYDQVNGWGLRYQPFLYELKQSYGVYAAGTILLAGNSIPDDLSRTQIDLYVSTDKGYTWEFVSHIASGGRALPNNGETPVWEPFILEHDDQLIVYYSDQRDPAHGQKLVHQVTSDLKAWGPVVDDVAYGNYTFRPGMTTISGLPNGQYILTYEFYGAPEADFAVYYRLSNSPLTFNNATGHPIIAIDGTVPVSSPYNIWTPIGSENGTIAVTCGTLSQVFLNYELAAPGSPWYSQPTPEGVSYSRSLRVLPNPSQILITGGGVLNGEYNSVTSSSIQVLEKPQQNI